MKKSNLPQLALLIAALAIGSAGVATDALARGGHGSVGHSHDSSAGGARASSSLSAGPSRGAVDRAREPAIPNRNVGGHDDWRDWQSPNG